MAVTLIYKPTRAKIGALELDASVREAHSASSEVTQHPVERGANVGDHIRPLPETVVIDGLVSNTPARAIGLGEDPTGRAASAYLALKQVHESGQLVTVTTKLRTYENMALTALSVPREAALADVLQFSATFVRVTVVSSLTVNLPAQTLKGLGKQKKGKQATKEADASTRASGLKTLTNWLGATRAGSGVDQSGSLF